MEAKTKRNIIWAGAAIIAVLALFANIYHLWTAAIFFALGCVQMEDVRKEDVK